MPCRSDYLAANDVEENLGAVLLFLKELKGKRFTRNEWDKRGYMGGVYNVANKKILDEQVAKLCGEMQKLDKHQVAECSLELQTWWRDHQAADKQRLKQEIKENKKQRDIHVALSKLNDYEKELLGL